MADIRKDELTTRNGIVAPVSAKQSPSHVSEYKMVGDAAEDKISPMRVLIVEVSAIGPLIRGYRG